MSNDSVMSALSGWVRGIIPKLGKVVTPVKVFTNCTVQQLRDRSVRVVSANAKETGTGTSFTCFEISELGGQMNLPLKGDFQVAGLIKVDTNGTLKQRRKRRVPQYASAYAPTNNRTSIKLVVILFLLSCCSPSSTGWKRLPRRPGR